MAAAREAISSCLSRKGQESRLWEPSFRRQMAPDGFSTSLAMWVSFLATAEDFLGHPGRMIRLGSRQRFTILGLGEPKRDCV